LMSVLGTFEWDYMLKCLRS